MKRLFHSGWLAFILTILIAFFPQVFQQIGFFVARCWSLYWLPVMLGVIILLLILILVHLFKHHKNTVP